MKSHSNPIKIITLFFVWNLKTFPLKFRIPIRIFPFLYGDPVILPPFFPKNIEKLSDCRSNQGPRLHPLVALEVWSRVVDGRLTSPGPQRGGKGQAMRQRWLFERHTSMLMFNDVHYIYIYIVCPLCLCLCLWFLLWVFTFVFIWFICVYVYVYAVAVAAAFLTFAWFACEIEGVAHSATDSNTQEYVYILYIYSSAPTPLKYG